MSDFFCTPDFRSRHTDLSLNQLADYYAGSQPLGFLHPELQQSMGQRLRSLVINLPRLVVDSIEERLDVEGFRVAGAEDADEELWRIWQANDLDEQSQQCHQETLVFGRGFVLVWGNDADPMTPRITVESCREMKVEYELGTHTIVSATKEWNYGGFRYRTRYDPLWIVRELQDAKDPAADWQLRADPIENFLGAVPVVPFANRPSLSRPQGESEMTDVIPIADAINKLATDMMVAAEFQAMPRRWATGIDLGPDETSADRVRAKIWEQWSNAEMGRVWASDSPNAEFGQFPNATLDNFTNAIDMLTTRAGALSGLPPHYFGQVGDNPVSADALRASEAPLVKRVQRKQRPLGGSWERVMRLALMIRNGGEVPDEYRAMETIWCSAETPTVGQKADAAVKLVNAGVITPEQAQEDLGYTPAQRTRMAEQRAAAQIGAVKAQVAEADRLIALGMPQADAYVAVGLLDSGGSAHRIPAGLQSPP